MKTFLPFYKIRSSRVFQQTGSRFLKSNNVGRHFCPDFQRCCPDVQHSTTYSNSFNTKNQTGSAVQGHDKSEKRGAAVPDCAKYRTRITNNSPKVKSFGTFAGENSQFRRPVMPYSSTSDNQWCGVRQYQQESTALKSRATVQSRLLKIFLLENFTEK